MTQQSTLSCNRDRLVHSLEDSLPERDEEQLVTTFPVAHSVEANWRVSPRPRPSGRALGQSCGKNRASRRTSIGRPNLVERQ